MKFGSILSLTIALILGALAAFIAKGVLQTESSAPVAAAPSRTVVVAAQPMTFGVPLTAENLREVPWPADSAIEGAFSSVNDLLKDGRRLTLANIQRSEPILSSKVTEPNQRATLSTLIEEGRRAVSVRVDDVRGVAGFILPGDHVDVILEQGAGAGAYTDVLFHNVKVLAIDQMAAERQDKAMVVRAVTLELDVQQAQKVVLAQGIGRLSLILRQAGRENSEPARRVTAADLGIGEAVQPRDEAADRIAALEARLEQLRKAAEQASAEEREAAVKRAAELEARLQDE